MRLSRTHLRKIITEELADLTEMCGCPANGGEPHLKIMHSVGDDDIGECGEDDEGEGLFSKDEALDLVSMIARRTSCPVTSRALDHVVSDLRHSEDGVEDSGQAIVTDLEDLRPSDAFGLGHGVGSGEVTDYDISG